MTALAELLHARLLGVRQYRPGLAAAGPASRKLSSNEAPLGPGPAIVAALTAAAGTVNRYPEEGALLAGIAAQTGVGSDQLVLTNGSDELCSLVALLFLGPGSRAVLGEPCYQIDAKVSALAGAELVHVALIAGGHDLSAMAAAARTAAVVWLPTPHNPTGVAVRPAELREFVAAVPPSCLVVVDEAYHAFADAEYRLDVAGLVAEFPNVLVQRTLSKDWGIAGVRIGYGIGSPDVVEALRRARAPFSVSALAVAAGTAGLRAAAWRSMAVARVREGRLLLAAELDDLGLEYLPSQANFVLVRIRHDRVVERLTAAGISVRPGEDLGMPGWVRITIGWAPIMADLRKLLRQEFASAAGGTEKQ